MLDDGACYILSRKTSRVIQGLRIYLEFGESLSSRFTPEKSY